METFSKPRKVMNRAKPAKIEKCFAIYVLIFIVATGCLFAAAQSNRPVVRVLVRKSADAAEWQYSAALRQQFSQRTGIDIEFTELPTGTTDYVAASIKAMLEASNPYIDVFEMDVVWVGEYDEWLYPLDGRLPQAVIDAHNEQNVAAGKVKGRLVAVPQQADYGVMFVRADLLTKYGYSSPPTTVDQMEEMINKIVPEERKSNPSFLGVSGQVKAYEGGTCNVLEWLLGENAGTVLEPDGTLSSLDQSSPMGQRALKVGHRWRALARKGWILLGQDEWPSMREWLRGNVLFHRNWPLVAVQTRQANVPFPWVMTRLPGNVGTLGGWLWGVSKFTKNPDAVLQVLQLFLSPEFQKIRTVQYGTPPTAKVLYNDSDVCAALGDCSLFRNINIATRPSGAAGKNYPEVTKAIYNYWVDIVSGVGTVEGKLAAMNRELARVLNIDVLGSPTNITIEHPLALVVVILTAFLLVLVALSALAVIALRKQRVIRNAGITYQLGVLAGLTLQLAFVLLLVGIPSPGNCQARAWLLGLGYTLVVGSITFRIFRIWSTFLNPFIKDKVVRRGPMLAIVAGLACIDMILIGILLGIDPPKPTDTRMPTSRYTGCVSTNLSFQRTMTVIIYLYHTLQMLAGLYIAFKARYLGQGFSENRAIGICLSNNAFMMLVVLPFVELDILDQSPTFALRALSALFIVSLYLGAYILPRVRMGIASWRLGESAAVDSEMSLANSTKGRLGGGGPRPGEWSLRTFQPGFGAQSSVSALGRGSPADGGHYAPTTPSHMAGGGGGTGDPHQITVPELTGFVDFHFGRSGPLSTRISNRRWKMAFIPWTLMRTYLFPKSGMLVFHDVCRSLGTHGNVIHLDTVLVAQSGPTVTSLLELDLANGDIIQIMAPSADDRDSWLASIQAGRSARDAASATGQQHGGRTATAAAPTRHLATSAASPVSPTTPSG